MPAGVWVFAAACLAVAVLRQVWRQSSMLRRWHYPALEEVAPGERFEDPLPDRAVDLWAAHDPTPLGFRSLGVLNAASYRGQGALLQVWLDETSYGTVALATFIPGGRAGEARLHRGFVTYHGDPAEPSALHALAASSSMLEPLVRPGSQVLWWAEPSQAGLLGIHRRQCFTVGAEPLCPTSLEDVRRLMARNREAERAWLISSGALRERTDGGLQLGGRAFGRSLWNRLPTARLARRRADRKATKTVSTWTKA